MAELKPTHDADGNVKLTFSTRWNYGFITSHSSNF